MDRTSRNAMIFSLSQKYRNAEDVKIELDRLGVRDYPARLRGNCETAGQDEEEYRIGLIEILVDNMQWIA